MKNPKTKHSHNLCTSIVLFNMSVKVVCKSMSSRYEKFNLPLIAAFSALFMWMFADGCVAQQVGGLGSEVLQMVFKFHRVAQQEVLSQLLNRIITSCGSPSVDSYFSEWVGVASVCCI